MTQTSDLTAVTAPRALPSGRDPGRWLLPSLGTFLAALALWQAVGPVAPALFSGDGDVGRHIRVGAHILETGSIPHRDVFSHTRRGAEFVPYEWLSEVLFALAHRWAGLAGVALLTGMLFAATGYLVYWTTVRHGTRRALAALVAAYALLLQGLHLLPRPHLFTTLLAAVFLAVLLEHRRTGRAELLLSLPVLMLLWANLHGGFLVGLIVIGAFWADAVVHGGWRHVLRGPARALAAAGGACLVASFLNPAGPALLDHVTGYLQSRFMAEAIREYGSPNFHFAEGQVFLVGLLLSLAVLALQRSGVWLVEALLVLLWTAAALYAVRNVPLYAVLVLPLVARWLSSALRTGAEERSGLWGRVARGVEARNARLSELDSRFSKPLAPALLFAAIVVWTLAHVGDARYSFSRADFPVDALRAARAAPVEGNVFNELHWGGYLLYEAPDEPVFIDGQVDFYGEPLVRDYYAIRNLTPQWRDLLERHRIGWTVTASGAPLNTALAEEPGWRPVHRDDLATVYVRGVARPRDDSARR